MTARIANRNRTIAAIHVLAAQLGMDTTDKSPVSEYRATLFLIGRAYSCTGLDYTALERVRAHLAQLARARGIEAPQHSALSTQHSNEWAWVDQAAEDRRPMLRKIIMLLKSAGRGKGYADGIAEAMFRIERLELCGTRELHAIVTALVKDARRHAMKEPA